MTNKKSKTIKEDTENRISRIDFSSYKKDKLYNSSSDFLEIFSKNPEFFSKKILDEISKGNTSFCDVLYTKPFMEKFNNVIPPDLVYNAALKGHTNSIITIMESYSNYPLEFCIHVTQINNEFLSNKALLSSKGRIILAFNSLFGICCPQNNLTALDFLSMEKPNRASLEKLFEIFVKDNIDNNNSENFIECNYFTRLGFDNIANDTTKVVLRVFSSLLEDLLNCKIKLEDDLLAIFEDRLILEKNKLTTSNQILFYGKIDKECIIIRILLKCLEQSKKNHKLPDVNIDKKTFDESHYNNIFNDGKNQGYNIGYDEGHYKGYDEGYNARYEEVYKEIYDKISDKIYNEIYYDFYKNYQPN